MPDKADHRVEMFHLAQQRLCAGLPAWERRIRVGDIFHNEDLTFEQRRDAIVKRIRASGWIEASTYGFGDLDALVDELADARDADGFDEVWDAIYDIADYDRVWIETGQNTGGTRDA